MTAQTGGTPVDPPSFPAGPAGQPAPVYGDVPRYRYQQVGPPSPPPAEQPPVAPSYEQPYQQPYQHQPPYQPPYQQPYQPPYQQPYAQPYPSGYGQPTPSAYPGYAVPVYAYSPWSRRVGAYLIDFLPSLIASIPFYIGYFVWIFSLAAQSDLEPYEEPDLTAGFGWMAVGGLLLLAALGWQIYNRWLIGGRTGQSLGKRIHKIKLVAEATSQPIGPLNAFLRDLLHIVDGLAYVGYLWPLWDNKRQTFADKLMKTVVHDVPQPPAAPAS